MDVFSVEITPNRERLDVWIPEIGCGTRAQFEDELDLVARNLLYIVTGRPRKSYDLRFDWRDSEK